MVVCDRKRLKFAFFIAPNQNALNAAAGPVDAAKAKRKIAELERMQATRKGEPSSPSYGGSAMPGSTLVTLEQGPKHPTLPADGPKHDVVGRIRDVKCSFPAVIEFRVEGAKSLSFYNNNYYKLDFSALGFTPAGTLQPCSDIDGMKARVE